MTKKQWEQQNEFMLRLDPSSCPNCHGTGFIRDWIGPRCICPRAKQMLEEFLNRPTAFRQFVSKLKELF